ncbi:hypothetical protein MMC10_009931 [Thelotrema lepadinum]|nr:hypothetical protein [Thelotrema lepadinum]
MRLQALPAIWAGLFLTLISAQQQSPSFPALSDSSTSTTTTAGPSSTDDSSAAATTTGTAAQPTKSFPALSSSFAIPSPSVPPTQMAPFMHTSPLPNNFVFICAGAIIGFFFAIVLVWRMFASWTIYRNIKRVNAGRAGASYTPLKSQKFGVAGASILKRPNAPFYSQGPGSELSLDPLTGGGNKSLGYSTPANRSSLFFSPTASATSATAVTGGSSVAGNRSSTHLPAGYYAAGRSGQGGGVAGNGRPVSMVDFTSGVSGRQTEYRPQSAYLSQSHRYSSSRLSVGGGPSPGPSPLLQPLTSPTDAPYERSSMARMSTASLGARSDGRAPSAYLEDLFDYPPVPQGRSASGGS